MPNKDFLFCPICNLGGSEDELKIHLIGFHRWSNLEIQEWLYAIFAE